MKIPTTIIEIRELIIFAKKEIKEYEKFIKLCENEIKKLRELKKHENKNKKTNNL